MSLEDALGLTVLHRVGLQRGPVHGYVLEMYVPAQTTFDFPVTHEEARPFAPDGLDDTRRALARYAHVATEMVGDVPLLVYTFERIVSGPPLRRPLARS